jgi:HAMP domain-containing protein/signal transduction histidine kinase/DNA-binding response OmpR family regulator
VLAPESTALSHADEMALILNALTQLKRGDAKARLPHHGAGAFGKVAEVFNDLVEQSATMAEEVSRLSQVVGKEGKLKKRASLPNARGFWAASLDSINSLIDDLVHPTSEVGRVIGAVAQGDLSKSMALELDGRALEGEFLRTAKTINKMVEQLGNFTAEVTRVAREVGTEGKLGGQAKVKGVAGTWKDLTDSVNSMAANLTAQVRNIADVTTAVAKGDLSKKIDVDVKGEFLTLKSTINTMVDQLRSFASEVTRVAREVGSDGILGGQARVEGVSGTWKDLTESVNAMAGNLTSQVRNIADVTKAVAAGDLSKKITVDVKGEILELKNTINTMVDQLRSFASEVTRVAREVGTEGKLGGQADVQGVAGTWRDLTDSVNSMAGNLTSQVRNIADVTKAVQAGDLSRKITVDVKGEILELKNTINTMVDQLSSFASEVTRVAREVGTEGRLGGQAEVEGVSGTWKDLTESVNSMAGNLTSQVRNIAEVTTAVAAGDLSKKITVDVKGEILELKNTINTMVDQLRSFAAEVTRVAREVGTEGKLGGQADVQGVAGTWRDLTDSVNSMAGNLTSQVRNIADVTKAVQAGDLSRKITVDVKGEILELKNTINTMVDQLSSFASEVTRVAREVGTEGRLGGQAEVRGVSGVWKDLTDNVNFMAGNLTSQVRGIAKVVTAVANGDLKQKLTVEAKGEIAALAETINSMTDTLATFADQVTTVAREVGVEGKLGGQAKVPGAAGIWKGLTENVNELAANLTTQVRAIADVATAVTQGDLTRSITVETQGEVAALKDTINEMIRNLKDTTLKNTAQDWLKTNLAKFSRMLQGQRDLVTVGQMILSELAPVVGAHQAEFYVLTSKTDSESPKLKLLASYASQGKRSHGKEIDLGEGLVGQVAIEKRRLLLTNVPSEAFRIATGLSESSVFEVLVLPVVFEGELRGVMELASLERFNPSHQAFLDELTESIGIVINTITANTRTEDLLKQSQSLAEELQQTNQELEEKARQLAHQNQEVERKNTEVEQARQALEEKAKQLALTSKYKSEFLANMSHELRTPLNSLLLLSDQLSRNAEGNLSTRQVEAAKTIHASGNDLLALINDILDLSKIESGTVQVDVSELRLTDLQRYVERTFRHIAESNKVGFNVEVNPAAAKSIHTDIKRLQQIIKNLLSNAFKFTHEGAVSFSVAPAASGWSPENEELQRAGEVLAFSVTDTGIGISAEKQHIIFEAFQQADGSTSRKYGGTGLGLAISRELSKLLGGEIRLASAPGVGSTFTLYLPHSYSTRGVARPRAALVEAPAVERRVEAEPLYTEQEFEPQANEAGDDRAEVKPDDLSILIVENDLGFAKVLLEAARVAGFKGLVAGTAAGALSMVKEYRPSVMTLDIFLPDMQGWRILDRLKADLSTRHIPVCVVSTDDSRERALSSGAIGLIAKPVASGEVIDRAIAQLKHCVTRARKKLVVLMEDGRERAALLSRLNTDDVEVEVCDEGGEACRLLRAEQVDCLVVQNGASDLQPGDLIEVLEQQTMARQLPVVLFGPEASDTLARWKRTDGLFALREARSVERLLDTIYFFLHRNVAGLPAEERKRIEGLHSSSRVLEGKKALIVDDDMRNIFALSTVLHDQGMQMISASNGREAIRVVKTDPAIDIVLMDIMMPEMDGMTTMQEIRKLPERKDLPIIAVTAKAMKGDREKCIRAGAWDYLSKPVDTVHLLAVLRGWLHR